MLPWNSLLSVDAPVPGVSRRDDGVIVQGRQTSNAQAMAIKETLLSLDVKIDQLFAKLLLAASCFRFAEFKREPA